MQRWHGGLNPGSSGCDAELTARGVHRVVKVYRRANDLRPILQARGFEAQVQVVADRSLVGRATLH
jgi:hypothetical protein